MYSDVKISSNRSFGIVFFIFFLIVGFYPLINDGDLNIWSLIISIIFLTLGILKSEILTPLNKLWFKFGLFSGKIISPFVMAIIFFLVVTPTGLFMRLLRKNLLNLRYSNDQSYWIKKNGPESKMKNQF